MIWWVWESLRYSWWESTDRWLGNKAQVVRRASWMETRRRARRVVSHFWSGWEVTVSGLSRGEEVVRRGAEVGWDARCCVKVATIRLLKEQIAAVFVLWRGEKNEAMWQVPQDQFPQCYAMWQLHKVTVQGVNKLLLFLQLKTNQLIMSSINKYEIFSLLK